MKKKRLFFLRATAVMVLTLVALLDVAFILHRDRATSPLENRSLQQRPALTVRGLLSGRFESRFDSYISDQFPLRDGFRTVKSVFHTYVLGQRDNNGIYLHNGYAAQQDYPLNEASVDHALDRFNKG